METLKNAVREVMRGLESKKARYPGDNPQEWLKKALTKKELGHIKVKYFSRGVLGLNVDSSAWLYVLGLKKEEVLSVLKKENPGLKDINLRIGEIS
jgi:hypothetical protein